MRGKEIIQHLDQVEMHILKIIHGYPPIYNAGSEVYSQSICHELSKNHKVSLFTREENPYEQCFSIRHKSLSENLDAYYVNNPQGKDGYRHQEMDLNFEKLVESLNPDVAHIGHLNHLSTGLVDVLNRKGIPILFTLHDFWLMCPRGQFLTRGIGEVNNFRLCEGQNDKKCASDCYKVYHSGIDSEKSEDEKRWSSWVSARMKETKSLIPKIDLFVAPSKYLRNRFIEDFSVPNEKIIYLDYGFPTDYLIPSQKTKSKTIFTFGYIGTHIPAKGINLLIEAFSQIEEKAELKIFGREKDQSTAALKEIASKSRNKVSFEGEYINRNLADEVFSKIDCIVVPSIWGENSPLVIHEAQACKIPVITANYGGMKEYVQHSVNGILFKHRDSSSLSEQMLFAIQNPEEMIRLGNRGYFYSEDGSVPDIKQHCKNLYQLYEKIKGKRFWRITIDTNPEDCNYKCIMCEEHSPYSDYIPKMFERTGIKRRRMDFQTVVDIFEQAKKLGVKEIIPSTMGEPLLYKEFDKIFDLAQQSNIKINLTTNGSFPKKSVLEWAKLIVPNTTDVKISWNGATEETAKKVMLGVDFHQNIENVREFIKFRNEYFSNTGYFCRVTFQLTFMQNNMHELADIVKLAAELGIDRVKGHQLWAHFTEIKDLSMKANSIGIASWNKYVKQAYSAQEKFRKPNGEKVLLENIIPLGKEEQIELPEEYECPFLDKELWVSATGKISPCCAPDELRQSLGDFGNIKDVSLAQVLQSSAYKQLVQNYKSKPLCKTCNMRKPR